MPPLRYYTMTQTRTVKISATNPVDAAALDDRVLSASKKPEDQINVQQWPEVKEINVREDDHSV